MSYCRIFRNGKLVSGIVRCSPNLYVHDPSIMIQIADDPKKFGGEINFEKKKVIVGRIQNEEYPNKENLPAQQLKDLLSGDSKTKWSEIAKIIQDVTGVPVCCSGVMEALIKSL